VSYPPAVSVGPLRATDLDGYRHLGVYKASDTSRSSTTSLTADPHLTLAVAASAVYLVTLALTVAGDAAGDFKFDFTVPTGATMSKYRYLANATGTTSEFGTLALASTAGSISCDGADRPLMIWGTLITTTNTGNITLRWAQNTSNAIGTVIRTASSMLLVRIG